MTDFRVQNSLTDAPHTKAGSHGKSHRTPHPRAEDPQWRIGGREILNQENSLSILTLVCWIDMVPKLFAEFSSHKRFIGA
ncbi:hypothetical protein [Ruegeria lacuscaerulensis]|uniref:hypothetical protein n=1 Tax=Ruegeria lacuscaerulensis TaxID=55218 RepID=UPI00148124BA|nr:hypothetical protein [Ruegeria lacuscaerulensis]